MLGKVIKVVSEEKNIDKASLSLPTDIFHISEIVKNLHSEDQTVKLAILLWLPQILRNPFKLSKFIDNEEMGHLKSFLLRSLNQTCCRQIKKKIILSIAFLACNSLRSENSFDLPTAFSGIALSERHTNDFFNLFFRFEGENFYIFGQKVHVIDFYSCLKQLSKLISVPDKYISFCDSDSTIIKRHKVKIISYNADSGIEELKKLISCLNFNDSKFGWTLSKSIYRMKRFIDKKAFVSDLKEMISGQIFSDEQLWINVMTILSFFLLDNEDIGDVNFLNQALLFDREFNTKAKCLREAALFLCWCLVRKDYGLKNIIHVVVFVALFDRDLSCRRAAASIVQEFIGRNQQTKKLLELLSCDDTGNTYDYSGVVNILEEYNKSKAESLESSKIEILERILNKDNPTDLKNRILLISPESVKRPLNCLLIFYFIKNKGIFKDLIHNMLWSYSRIARIQASFVIANFYNILEIKSDYSTVYKIDGLNLLISKALSFFRPSLTPYSSILLSELQLTPNISLRKILDTQFTTLNYSIGSISESYSFFLSSFVITPELYSLRNSKDAISSYLELYDIVDSDTFKTNLLFLVTKGFSPDLMLKVFSRTCCGGDPDFDKKVFKVISRNETGLLVNTKNLTCRQEVIIKYKNNIIEGIWSSQSIRALVEMEYFDDEIFEKIFGLLEDYSIGYEGDAGYFNRLESMKYFLKMKTLKIEVPKKFIIENYMIRFLTDKSKKLREDVLKMLLEAFPQFLLDFQYLAGFIDTGDLKESVEIDKRYEVIFYRFFSTHSKLCKVYKSELAYFKALFETFSVDFESISCSAYFYSGIISTLGSADGYLRQILLDLIKPVQSAFIRECLNVVDENKSFVLPALKFLHIFKDDEKIKSHLLKLDQESFSHQEKLVFSAILNCGDSD